MICLPAERTATQATLPCSMNAASGLIESSSYSNPDWPEGSPHSYATQYSSLDLGNDQLTINMSKQACTTHPSPPYRQQKSAEAPLRNPIKSSSRPGFLSAHAPPHEETRGISTPSVILGNHLAIVLILLKNHTEKLRARISNKQDRLHHVVIRVPKRRRCNESVGITDHRERFSRAVSHEHITIDNCHIYTHIMLLRRHRLE